MSPQKSVSHDLAAEKLISTLCEDKTRMTSLISQLNAIYIICDAQFKISYINQLGLSKYGISHAHELGKLQEHLTWPDLPCTSDSPLTLNNELVFLKSEEHSSVPYRVCVTQSSDKNEYMLLLSEMHKEDADNGELSDSLQMNRTLSKIAEASTSSIIAINEKQEILYINQGCRNIFGYHNDEVIGRRVDEFKHEFNTDIATKKRVMRAITDGKSMQGTGLFHSKQGVPVATHFELYPVETLPNQPKIAVVISRDMRDKLKLQEELNSAQTLLEEVSTERTRLLANISHELRTPLTSIKGILNELSTSASNEDDEASVLIALHATDSLNAIISDMLSFARGSIEHVEIVTKAVDLLSFTRSLEGLAKQQYINPDINFQVRLQQPAPSHVLLDAMHMQQVLLNLISNAFKFCKVGEITVLLSCEPSNTANNEYVLQAQVIDTGMGIESSKLDTIFTPFKQLNNQPSRANQGLGLGLAIVQKLVSSMSGTIEVESVLTKGTTFTVKIPTCSVYRKAAETHTRQLPPPSNLHILVVDDNETNAGIVKRHLGKFGNTVVFANNGKEAIKRIANEDIDIVLMDIQMPVMDGFEASSIIRNAHNKGWSDEKINIPIIGFTADSSVESIESCTLVGMNSVVFKPIDYQSLYRAIHDCMHHNSSQTEPLSAEPNELSTELAQLYKTLSIDKALAAKLAKIFDLNTALRYAEGNLAFLVECFESFQKHANELVFCVRDCKSNQYCQGHIEFSTHQLASSAGIVGAQKLSKLCKKISANMKSTGVLDAYDTVALKTMLEIAKEGSDIILCAYNNRKETA